jgi:hypothetical protein
MRDLSVAGVGINSDLSEGGKENANKLPREQMLHKP